MGAHLLGEDDDEVVLEQTSAQEEDSVRLIAQYSCNDGGLEEGSSEEKKAKQGRRTLKFKNHSMLLQQVSSFSKWLEGWI